MLSAYFQLLNVAMVETSFSERRWKLNLVGLGLPLLEFDFTFHCCVGFGRSLNLPEISVVFGRSFNLPEISFHAS